MILTPELAAEYQRLYGSMTVQAAAAVQARTAAARVRLGEDRYRSVGEPLGIPWEFIGILHLMECNLNWTLHLHNGDPLTARTFHVPEGRPTLPLMPPFTWEQSAADALHLFFATASDWSVPGMLFEWEKWNGWGYRSRGVNSPYLWAGTQHYTAGKFTADGVYDPRAVSQQLGCAVVLQAMNQLQDGPLVS